MKPRFSLLTIPLLLILLLCACQPLQPVVPYTEQAITATGSSSTIPWPGPRNYHQMAYDSESQRIILLGGQLGSMVPQGNTWLYNHATQQWQQLTLDNAPEPRGFHSLIYEPMSKEIILFGGGTDRNRAYGDLWRFDPIAQSWTEITPTGAPSTAVAPAEDTIDILNYLHNNATVLGTDPQRTCIWASSANPPPAIDAMTKADEPYFADLCCAVILYGAAKQTTGSFPSDFALMAVRVGKDYPGFSDAMFELTDWAQAEGVAVSIVDYADGEHAFDVFMDTPEAHEIIGQVLEFLQAQLQVAP